MRLMALIVLVPASLLCLTMFLALASNNNRAPEADPVNGRAPMSPSFHPTLLPSMPPASPPSLPPSLAPNLAANFTWNGTCHNRCGDDRLAGGCRCDVACTSDTCCSDYVSACFSCENRCTQSVRVGAPCQCDSRCGGSLRAPDCCTDYTAACSRQKTVSFVSDGDIRQLTEELADLDVNNVAKFITVNIQRRTTMHDRDDVSALPLFNYVASDAFKPETIRRFEALTDNYFLEVTEEEDAVLEEQAEVTAFLDAVVNTSVMEALERFLVDRDLINGTLRSNLERIWFTVYSRYGTVLGTSGFEHVFIGELDAGTVGGFHNWIVFYREEQNGRVDYQGNIHLANLSSSGYVLTNRFTWHNTSKPIGGGFFGPSPEFELAIFSLCFFVRPNTLCPVQINGVQLDIQTYNYYGKQLVGTAYPIVTQNMNN